MQALAAITAFDRVRHPDLRRLALAVKDHGIVIAVHLAKGIIMFLRWFAKVIIPKLDGGHGMGTTGDDYDAAVERWC